MLRIESSRAVTCSGNKTLSITAVKTPVNPVACSLFEMHFRNSDVLQDGALSSISGSQVRGARRHKIGGENCDTTAGQRSSLQQEDLFPSLLQRRSAARPHPHLEAVS